LLIHWRGLRLHRLRQSLDALCLIGHGRFPRPNRLGRHRERVWTEGDHRRPGGE
jgi:hypothetical protein